MSWLTAKTESRLVGWMQTLASMTSQAQDDCAQMQDLLALFLTVGGRGDMLSVTVVISSQHYFFVMDRSDAITWHRLPNKSSCHCLCHGDKGQRTKRSCSKSVVRSVKLYFLENLPVRIYVVIFYKIIDPYSQMDVNKNGLVISSLWSSPLDCCCISRVTTAACTLPSCIFWADWTDCFSGNGFNE